MKIYYVCTGNLEFKYKSLEETSVDLEEKLRSNTAVLPNGVSNANLGTEVIVKHTTLASKSVQIFSGYEM